MAEMIGAELRFEAAGDAAFGACHDTRVVDQNVKRTSRRDETLGEGTYAIEILEVHRRRFDSFVARRRAKVCRSLLAFFPRTHRHDDTRAGARQSANGFHAETGRCTGHDGGFAFEVDSLDDLACNGTVAERRIKRSLSERHGCSLQFSQNMRDLIEAIITKDFSVTGR